MSRPEKSSDLKEPVPVGQDSNEAWHGASSPSPRLRGEGRGEGAHPYAEPRGEASSADPTFARKPDEVDRSTGTGRRIVAVGAVLLLVGALAIGTWQHFALHAQVVATAQQQHEF
jgi:hypothetical protein